MSGSWLAVWVILRSGAGAASVNDHGRGIVPELRAADRPLYSFGDEREPFAS
jgi:hypothetical protein